MQTPRTDNERPSHAPLRRASSYPPVMREIYDNWMKANEALSKASEPPITLSGGYSAKDLDTDREEILRRIRAQSALDRARIVAAAERDQAKASLIRRHAQVRSAMTAALSGEINAESAPALPPFGANRSRFMKPFEDLAHVWKAVNALPESSEFAPPLTIGSYKLEDFIKEIEALREMYRALDSSILSARMNRDERDFLLPKAKMRMRQYKNAVFARLGAGHPLVMALPVLSAPHGNAPDAVTLTGEWDEAEGKVRLAWTASSNERLVRYDVRVSPVPKYRAKDERTLAKLPKTQTTFLTDAGLETPGASALFKVYVVLDSRRAKGSNAVRVRRA